MKKVVSLLVKSVFILRVDVDESNQLTMDKLFNKNDVLISPSVLITLECLGTSWKGSQK